MRASPFLRRGRDAAASPVAAGLASGERGTAIPTAVDARRDALRDRAPRARPRPRPREDIATAGRWLDANVPETEESLQPGGQERIEQRMPTKPLIVAPGDRPRPLHVVGEQITVLASKVATGGYEIFFQDGPAGSGPPPHSHPWDESFYVIRGDIEFGVADSTMTGGRDTLVHVPAGTVHWFRFCEGGGQMLSVAGAGSEASALFTDIDAEIPPGAPDEEKLRSIAVRNRMQVFVE